MNSGSRRDGGGGRRCSSRAATGRRWRSGNDGPMGKGGGGTDKTRGVGGGREIKGEEGRGCRWVSSCSASSGGTRSWRGAAGDRYRGGDNGDGEGGGTDKKLAVCQRAAERDERGSRRCRREGRTIPCKTLGKFGSRGHAGAMMAGIRNLFICQEYYLVLRLPSTC
jgi:hypothetical protein